MRFSNKSIRARFQFLALPGLMSIVCCLKSKRRIATAVSRLRNDTIIYLLFVGDDAHIVLYWQKGKTAKGRCLPFLMPAV